MSYYLIVFVAIIMFACYHTSKEYPTEIDYLPTIFLRQTYGTRVVILTHMLEPFIQSLQAMIKGMCLSILYQLNLSKRYSTCQKSTLNLFVRSKGIKLNGVKSLFFVVIAKAFVYFYGNYMPECPSVFQKNHLDF